MKFAFTALLATIASVSASTSQIKVGDTLTASSAIGRHLLSQARSLANDDGQQAMSWMGDFSLKFQGCHHLTQWNDQAQDENDVRFYQKRLVRFRMCPTSTCSATDAKGCSSDYGDYIVDLDIYLQAYYNSKLEAAQETCGQYIENNCNCQGNGDDNFDQAGCQFDCIKAAGMTDCYQYMEDMQHQDVFAVEDYIECAQFQYNNQNGGRRLDQQQAEYYVGSFCAQQGGAINLGMFSDDTCSTVLEDGTYGADTFKSMTGFQLPYSDKSLVGSDCLSCSQIEQDNNNNNNGNQIAETCQETYAVSGKCEAKLTSGPSSPNDNACQYISGIKVVREDGMVFYQKAHANAVSTSFIVIFAMAFFAMGIYSWYLRTRLNGSKQPLLS